MRDMTASSGRASCAAFGDIEIYSAPLPFSDAIIHARALEGGTLEEIIAEALPIDLRGVNIIAMVDGEPIPREMWPYILPRSGQIINLRVVPSGGKGKQLFAVVLAVVVAVAAPMLSGAILGSALAGTAVVGTVTYGSLLTTAIGAVGMMLVSALAPPPRPSGLGGFGSPAESPTMFIEGARNRIDRFGIVPICLGTNRMVPPQSALPYTETVGSNQYVRHLFCWGYGDLEVTDFKIGDDNISNFSGVDLEHKLAGNLHTGTRLFSNSVFQDSVSVRLTTTYATRTTQTDTDEAVVEVTFPQGLVFFNGKGEREMVSVTISVQYRPASGGTWKGTSGFVAQSAEVFSITPPIRISAGHTFRRDLAVINKTTGDVHVLQGTPTTSASPTAPNLPSWALRLASIISGSASNDVNSIIDERQPSLFGVNFQNTGDFAVTKTATRQITVAAGSFSAGSWKIEAATAQPLREEFRFKFPTSGQWEIRIKRDSAEAESNDRLQDAVFFTALKSVKNISPVTLEDVSGTAVRIKATDQLNGALEQFNALVSSLCLDWDADTETWIKRRTSNPASLYRHVLQGDANALRLENAALNLSDLQDWHEYCEAQGYTYNRVVDYGASVDQILRDVASAGAASPAIIDGLRTVVVDRVKDGPVQIVTPRNSWGYEGQMIFPKIPHAFHVQFRNGAKGYLQDEVTVYADGFNAGNATIFETLELQSCTNSDLAFKTARRHLAALKLRPETHTFNMGIDHIVARRGDRITLVNDVPLVGLGQARIKTIGLVGSPAEARFTTDETFGVLPDVTIYARVRLAEGAFLYQEVENIGATEWKFVSVPDPLPAAGDLVYFVEAGQELDLVVTRIEAMADLTAQITAINYNPAIFTAETAPIPPFNSKITVPVELQRPLPPILISANTSADVMMRAPDGSFISRAILTFENPNRGDVTVQVLLRETGSTVWRTATLLEATPEQVSITDLQSGDLYDLAISYRRSGSSMISAPLQLNNFLYDGISGAPGDVENFRITVIDNLMVLRWDGVTAVDLSHYELRFSRLFSGAEWDASLVVEGTIREEMFSGSFQPGTYFIKAVDLSGNYSENAAVIITFDPGVFRNVVQTITENDTYAGAKTNVQVVSDGLELISDASEGIYYFDGDIDLGHVYTSFVSSELVVTGALIDSELGPDVFDMADVFSVPDLFGVSTTGWTTTIEIRTTLTDPAGSPPNWTTWEPLKAGDVDFRAAQFRLRMSSSVANITPRILGLSVTIDMPDRIVRGEDLTVPVGGSTITYDPAFRASPAVAITLQDAAVDDKVEFTAKTSGGFTFKVYNATSAGYVERVYDYIASGFGREGD